MKQFNKLTPAEAERLFLLLEEMGEAQQAIGKVLRHGYESSNPDQLVPLDNRYWLARELGDVRAAMIILCDSGDVSKDLIHASAHDKIIRVKQWLHHQ
jgi:NTP pyrophosphatase (non-canonical NTP hydrolase)